MRKILLVFIVLISLIGCGKDRDKILKYLGKKYKEEFVVKYEVPTRKGGTMAVVIPKRYLGTSKEKDKFYEAEVTYRDGEIRKDDYIWVKNRESIEVYVKPEIEKIFGKNVLVALDGGRYREGNFKDDLELLKKSITEEERRKNSFQIEGGIYIFGRVESEEDREKYRRGIYEFIQYLKQEGMFEYVDMTIFITDERFLSKEFDKLGIHEKLLKNYREYDVENETPEEIKAFKERKRKIYSIIGEKYTLDLNKINEISRYQVIKLNENLMCGIIAHSRIVSEKAIKTNYFLKDKKIKQYDKLEDVELW